MTNVLKRTLKIFLLLIVISNLTTNFAVAQVLNDSNTQETVVKLKMSPENPKEGDVISLSLSSYNINLDTSKVTWYVDGKIQKDGIGVKNIEINSKNNGQKTIIEVLVVASDDTKASVSKEIISNNVDIVIEPTSYTPPFYKGKSIFSNQGSAKIVAIPNIFIDGKKIESKNLIFKWKKDNINLAQNSGMGKNSIVISGGVPINDVSITLEVLDSSNSTITSSSIRVTPDQPKIVFYENNSLYGILYNKAITGNYFMGSKEELNVTAKPFYFNINSDSSSDLLYKWFVNDTPVILDNKVNELLLKQTENSLRGNAQIRLELNNKVKIFQFAKTNISVGFGQ